MRTLRENGPIVLVPAAWTLATAAHYDVVGLHPLFVAHVVMDVVLVAFTVASWSEMQAGVLRAWKAVLVAGLGVTLVGTVGLYVRPVITPLLAVTVFAWMLLPAAALSYTAQHVERAPWAYLLGAVLSVLGAGVYAAAGLLPPAVAPVFVGLTLVNAGQTLGIATAVYQY